MAKKHSKSSDSFIFLGFINLSFTVTERQAIGAWLEMSNPSVSDSLSVLTEGGYKVSVSYNDYQGASQVGLTCREEGSKYYGYCFTLVHADAGKAILVFRYFYDSMLATENYEIEDKGKEFDW